MILMILINWVAMVLACLRKSSDFSSLEMCPPSRKGMCSVMLGVCHSEGTSSLELRGGQAE